MSYMQESGAANSTSLARSPEFRLQPGGSGLALLPNECSRGLVEAGGPLTEQRFEPPQLKGVAVDWCRSPDSSVSGSMGSGCGQEAALAFCKANGYSGVGDLAGPVPVPADKQSVYAGTGEACEAASQCQTFYYISCTV